MAYTTPGAAAGSRNQSIAQGIPKESLQLFSEIRAKDQWLEEGI